MTMLLGTCLWWILNRLAIIPLQKEIAERKAAEKQLKENSDHMEELIAERTTALAKSNEELQREVLEREQAERAVEELKRRI